MTGRPTDRHTDRPTDRARYWIGNNRPHRTYVRANGDAANKHENGDGRATGMAKISMGILFAGIDRGNEPWPI